MRSTHQDDSPPGRVAGLYLKPEKRSRVQFQPVLLAKSGSDDVIAARHAIDRELNCLFNKHGIDNVDFYVERSLGLDVQQAVAWCNQDLTDLVIV